MHRLDFPEHITSFCVGSFGPDYSDISEYTFVSFPRWEVSVRVGCSVIQTIRLYCSGPPQVLAADVISLNRSPSPSLLPSSRVLPLRRRSFGYPEWTPSTSPFAGDNFTSSILRRRLISNSTRLTSFRQSPYWRDHEPSSLSVVHPCGPEVGIEGDQSGQGFFHQGRNDRNRIPQPWLTHGYGFFSALRAHFSARSSSGTTRSATALYDIL